MTEAPVQIRSLGCCSQRLIPHHMIGLALLRQSCLLLELRDNLFRKTEPEVLLRGYLQPTRPATPSQVPMTENPFHPYLSRPHS